ncbi:hypothetical protein EDD68_10856 [Melghiribacillus thermohalophilus]|uniref:Thioredoxin n=1 Tax=Melghiribacillus thermohalophilus TaxID=1324956 RepID=A0A4R3N3P9_9BACI|nr:hypothetical protein [Melghiribacillus thermohalophilus]TCT22636.1 hypothetical protein EDD68_10856 [Melghiribacillus thermohalophilus]
MEKAWASLGVLLLLFSNSCTGQQTPAHAVKFESEEYQMIFISDNQHRESQEEYLDAILEIQNSDGFNQFQWRQKILKKGEFPDLSFSSFPALIIMKDGQVLKSISGDQPGEVIISQVLELFSE